MTLKRPQMSSFDHTIDRARSMSSLEDLTARWMGLELLLSRWPCCSLKHSNDKSQQARWDPKAHFAFTDAAQSCERETRPQLVRRLLCDISRLPPFSSWPCSIGLRTSLVLECLEASHSKVQDQVPWHPQLCIEMHHDHGRNGMTRMISMIAKIPSSASSHARSLAVRVRCWDCNGVGGFPECKGTGPASGARHATKIVCRLNEVKA